MTTPSRMVLASLLLALVAGCRWPWEPDSVLIRGTVRHLDGSTAAWARVELQNGDAAFADWTGRFSLNSWSEPGDSMTVNARDFCRGACSETRAGHTTFVVRESWMIVNIVLDETTAI